MAIGFNLSSKISGAGGAEVYIDNVQVSLNEIRLKTHDIMPSLISINANLANGAVTLNNELHVIAGTNHVKWNGSQWITVSTLPHNCSCLTIFNNELHVFGGSTSEYYQAHLKWNGSQWITVSTLPLSSDIPKHAIIFNNELYIFYSSYLYKLDGTNWSQVNNLPYNDTLKSICVYDNKIHMLGGISNVNKHYTLEGTNWNQETDLSFECVNCTSIVFNNKLHVLGGNSSGNYKNHYSYDGTSWTKETDLPFNLIGGSSSIYNNKLVILGGTAAGSGSLFFYLNSYLVESIN